METKHLVLAALLAACGGSKGSSPDSAVPVDMSATPDLATPGDASSLDAASTDGAMPSCITPAATATCAAPVNSALPYCKLSQTGCMDPTNVTAVNSAAVYYEVNSPLWSDGAAKNRAFVLPAGGKIHVKDCSNTTTPPAECISPSGVPNGAADTGKWVFPVGTVMIKNFLFDGKLVETRLFMHVDDNTAALIGNGTSWVGYNYMWNEAQTEATVTDGTRTNVQFNTGKQTVAWSYPSFNQCIQCHSAAVGTIGPESAQMNRTVNSKNQITTFATAGLFDTAPKTPYPAPTVEPYTNATLGLTGTTGATTDQEARSYLSANCGFCHRPDTNDQGFDLRYSLTLFQTKICGLTQQNGIPGMTSMTYEDFKPGDHANSAMWIRMNIVGDPTSTEVSGRMPITGSYVVDPQASTLLGTWIDGIKTCPTM